VRACERENVCICVSVCVWVSECVWVSVSECVCVCEWVSEWVCVSECVWVSECEWVSECVCVCVCVRAWKQEEGIVWYSWTCWKTREARHSLQSNCLPYLSESGTKKVRKKWNVTTGNRNKDYNWRAGWDQYIKITSTKKIPAIRISHRH